MKFYLLLCRMRAHIETTLVPKCEALTTQAFKNSGWRRAPPKKRENKKKNVSEEDDEDKDDGLSESGGDNKEKSKKRRRSNSVRLQAQNKDGARNGDNTRTATPILSPSPRYPLDKQSILAPDFSL